MIIEKKLGIPPDYQYKALRNGIWLQRNWHKNKLKALQSIMKIDCKFSVLDLGTGSGNFEIFFSKKFNSITGVDYNDEAISFLNKYLRKNKIKNIELVQSDIRQLPKIITQKKYNLIVIVDVIEHIKMKEANKLINQAKKLLKKKGELIIITPNYKSLWTNIEVIMDKLKIVPKFGNEQHLSKFNNENLTKILEKTGYSSIKSRSFNLFSFLSPFDRLNNLLLKIELKILGNLGCLTLVSGRKN